MPIMRARHLAIILVLTSVAPTFGAPTAQTRPWRIGIGGAYCTGYMGLFALHGLPRERLDDSDLLDLARLKQYDIILVGWRNAGNPQATTVLEDYVRDGGIAITETVPPPSPAAIPGTRIGPAPTPNLRFVDSGTPITKDLPQMGIIPSAGVMGSAVIPAPNSGAIILARFTDEAAPRKTQGKFVINGEGAPAIVMASLGKGKLIYCGASMSYAIALRGREFEPFLMNLLSYVTNGEVTERFYSGTVERSSLVTLDEEEPEEPPLPHPAGEAKEPPAGYETLEDADNLQDFALTGKLPANGDATVLLSYWSPQDNRQLVFTKNKVSLLRNTAGKSVTVSTGALQPGSDLLIRRRYGLVTVKAGPGLALAACDGPPLAGALAVKGLKDPEYQPLDAVVFDDDFMRETAASDDWKPVTGRWSVEAAEGKPEMGANPFDYVADDPGQSISTIGNWFWSDYALEAAVRPAGEAVGLIAAYTSPEDYVLLRLSFATQPAKLQLVRRLGGQDKLLAEKPVDRQKGDWQRLGLRTSGGALLGLLDDEPLLQATAADYPCGQIGLYCQGGRGNFDDIRVTPWIATIPGPVPWARELVIMQGEWQNSRDGRLLNASGSSGARALAPWHGGSDCQASVQVKLGQAAAAGLHLRYQTPQSYYLLALMPDGNKLKVRAYRHGNPGNVLAERVLSGDRNQWHTLQAVVRGRRLRALVDGKELLDLLDTGHLTGSVGLYARGSKPASFREFRAASLDPDEQVVDELTPAFAGIIDRHTWAGRSGAWTPEPTHLDRMWHQGYLPGDLQVAVGVHSSQAPVVKTDLYLSPEHQTDKGYALQAVRNWAANSVDLVLTRLGQTVARAQAKVAPGTAYAIRLARRGSQLLATINNLPALLFHDKQPLEDVDSIGLDNEGSLLYADDLSVKSTRVYDYMFEVAPTDWTVQSGTWEITSRWSCTPGWAWFTGLNPTGPAEIMTKQSYQGDQQVVCYVGAKMMPAGEKRYSERLSDVHLAFLVDPAVPGSGYHFVLGGNGNTWTGLRRNGTNVASSTYRLPAAGIHNDWLKLTMRKRGNKIYLWAWDVKVLEYEDPEPLNSGRIAVGTYQNGILVPRITVFGERQ